MGHHHLFAIACVWLALLTVQTRADECDALAARVLADVRGTSFDKKSITGRDVDLRHPDVGALTVHCRISDDLPEAVSIIAYAKLPDAKFFDLVGRAGAAITGAPASRIALTAKSCHQRALADLKSDYSEAHRDEKWGSFKCDASPGFAKIEITKRGGR